MSDASFDEIWTARIGEPAAGELRRNGYLTLVVWPFGFGLAVVSSFTLPSGKTVEVVLGVVAAVLAAAALVVWIRSRMALAQAMSDWFGIPIKWTQITKMRTKPFDAWCEKRHLRAGGDAAAPSPQEG